MKIGHSTCPHAMRTSLLALLLGATIEAWGCMCDSTEKKGFLHAGAEHERVLPANARGVLFLTNPDINPAMEQVYEDNEGNVLLAAVPPPLAPEQFVVMIEGKAQQVHVTPVDVTAATNTRPKRYYRSQDPLWKDCFACMVRESRKDMDWLRKARDAGALVDITEEVKRARGLFRIGPADGFKPGKTYTFKYLPRHNGWEYPDHIEVSIAGANVPIVDHGYAVEPDGEPRRQLLQLAGGGSCTVTRPATVQRLRYRIPAAYEPYRDSLLFFTAQKYATESWHPYGSGSDAFSRYNDASSVEEQIGAFFVNTSPRQWQRQNPEDLVFKRWAYVNSLCSEVPFGGSQVGTGQELVYTACERAGQKLPASQVKGWVGMLEVEDKLHETVVLDIEFNAAASSACDNLGMLKDALASEDIEAQRATVCGVPLNRGGDNGKLASDMLPLLLGAAKHSDPTLRSCVAGAITSFDSNENKLSAVSIVQIAELLASQLADIDIKVRQNAARQTGYFLRERLRAAQSAEAALRDTILILLPALKLALDDADQWVRISAAEDLGILGPRATSAVDLLLKAVTNEEAGNAARIATVLVAIAPDDQRVPTTLQSVLVKNKNETADGSKYPPAKPGALVCEPLKGARI